MNLYGNDVSVFFSNDEPQCTQHPPVTNSLNTARDANLPVRLACNHIYCAEKDPDRSQNNSISQLGNKTDKDGRHDAVSGIVRAIDHNSSRVSTSPFEDKRCVSPPAGDQRWTRCSSSAFHSSGKPALYAAFMEVDNIAALLGVSPARLRTNAVHHADPSLGTSGIFSPSEVPRGGEPIGRPRGPGKKVPAEAFQGCVSRLPSTTLPRWMPSVGGSASYSRGDVALSGLLRDGESTYSPPQTGGPLPEEHAIAERDAMDAGFEMKTPAENFSQLPPASRGPPIDGVSNPYVVLCEHVKSSPFSDLPMEPWHRGVLESHLRALNISLEAIMRHSGGSRAPLNEAFDNREDIGGAPEYARIPTRVSTPRMHEALRMGATIEPTAPQRIEAEMKVPEGTTGVADQRMRSENDDRFLPVFMSSFDGDWKGSCSGRDKPDVAISFDSSPHNSTGGCTAQSIVMEAVVEDDRSNVKAARAEAAGEARADEAASRGAVPSLRAARPTSPRRPPGSPTAAGGLVKGIFSLTAVCISTSTSERSASPPLCGRDFLDNIVPAGEPCGADAMRAGVGGGGAGSRWGPPSRSPAVVASPLSGGSVGRPPGRSCGEIIAGAGFPGEAPSGERGVALEARAVPDKHHHSRDGGGNQLPGDVAMVSGGERREDHAPLVEISKQKRSAFPEPLPISEIFPSEQGRDAGSVILLNHEADNTEEREGDGIARISSEQARRLSSRASVPASEGSFPETLDVDAVKSSPLFSLSSSSCFCPKSEVEGSGAMHGGSEGGMLYMGEAKPQGRVEDTSTSHDLAGECASEQAANLMSGSDQLSQLPRQVQGVDLSIQGSTSLAVSPLALSTSRRAPRDLEVLGTFPPSTNLLSSPLLTSGGGSHVGLSISSPLTRSSPLTEVKATTEGGDLTHPVGTPNATVDIDERNTQGEISRGGENALYGRNSEDDSRKYCGDNLHASLVPPFSHYSILRGHLHFNITGERLRGVRSNYFNAL